ncbi:argininosuccinate lyase [Variovorax terrae]|uniref:Argininosuccinate lyase n=1 Tax=Variovorax terrae TaxID=2923278 RepID=A0A9X1VT22_9BURK|nr:argininosuccinate lyase [Variovorax terrae]MCJ0763316.1 argininosuccinate lyase [Variovorax terrae]
MSVYRAAKIRLSENVRPELARVCLPGPDAAVLGQYARMGPQLAAFHAFDKAHILMLAEEGLLPKADAAAMLRELRKVEQLGAIEARAATAEHMHSGEAILTGALGPDVAGKMHLGRSSGDLLAVSFRYTLRGKLLLVAAQLNELRQMMLDLVPLHIDTVMPGCTHLQHAQPESFAHYLLSWASAFDRDAQRIRQYFARLNTSPAGAAILNGSEFPLNRERTASLLGFDGLALNTRDAVWGRDLEIEAHAITTLLAGNFNRLAEDLMLWSAPEFGLVECADGFCGTSSIMPQKKNPNALECLKGVVATSTGYFVSTAMIHKNPSTVPVFEWVRSMSDAWRSYDEMSGALPLMTAVLGSLTVRAGAMASTAGRHWATATDLASAIVRSTGLPWRAAHQITGIVVRLSLEAGRTPADVDTALVDRAAIEHTGQPLGLDPAVIASAMDPAESVRRHQMPGGPAPQRVQEALALHAEALAADLRWLEAAQARVAEAQHRLEAGIDALLG